mgnify:CR=1 FL=1
MTCLMLGVQGMLPKWACEKNNFTSLKISQLNSLWYQQRHIIWRKLKSSSALSKMIVLWWCKMPMYLKSKGKWHIVQPYLSGLDGSPTLKPFILILQNPWNNGNVLVWKTLGQSTPSSKQINLGYHYIQQLHQMLWAWESHFGIYSM